MLREIVKLNLFIKAYGESEDKDDAISILNTYLHDYGISANSIKIYKLELIGIYPVFKEEIELRVLKTLFDNYKNYRKVEEKDNSIVLTLAEAEGSILIDYRKYIGSPENMIKILSRLIQDYEDERKMQEIFSSKNLGQDLKPKLEIDKGLIYNNVCNLRSPSFGYLRPRKQSSEDLIMEMFKSALPKIITGYENTIFKEIEPIDLKLYFETIDKTDRAIYETLSAMK